MRISLQTNVYSVPAVQDSATAEAYAQSHACLNNNYYISSDQQLHAFCMKWHLHLHEFAHFVTAIDLRP